MSGVLELSNTLLLCFSLSELLLHRRWRWPYLAAALLGLSVLNLLLSARLQGLLGWPQGHTVAIPWGLRLVAVPVAFGLMAYGELWRLRPRPYGPKAFISELSKALRLLLPAPGHESNRERLHLCEVYIFLARSPAVAVWCYGPQH